MWPKIIIWESINLTLRGLSLFFKTFPFPTLASLLHIFWYYFYQLAYWDSKVPKCFVGLIQMQHFASFDCNWGKQNDPIACWHQWYWVLQQGKCLSYPSDCVGWITKSPNCVDGKGTPLQTPINGKTPQFELLPCAWYLGRRAAEKPSTFFKAILMGLSLTPITNI